jgi:hypothetical protein
MAQANDSVLVTPGSGATVATQLAGSKEHELWVRAEPRAGHLWGAVPMYVGAMLLDVVHETTEAGQTTWELFNASGSGKTVALVHWMWGNTPNTLAMGNAARYEIRRVTAKSTGGGGVGGTVTLNPLDTSNPAVPSQITFLSEGESGPLTGGTATDILWETDRTGSGIATNDFVMLNMLMQYRQMSTRPRGPWAQRQGTSIICREGEGVRGVIDTGNDNYALRANFTVAIY